MRPTARLVMLQAQIHPKGEAQENLVCLAVQLQGIVVGVVGGIALLTGAVLIIYRRKQQRLRIIRQQNSARAVKWNEQPRDSNSNRSVRMQNMP